jgi:hypothetical protein
MLDELPLEGFPSFNFLSSDMLKLLWNKAASRFLENA